MIKKHNFFWYGLSFTIKSIIPLVSLPWFSKFLSLEEFGIFALSIFFGTFISGISNLGLLNVFERNYFEISENEIKTAKEYGDSYYIYQVTSALTNPEISTVIKNLYEYEDQDRILIEPMVYRVSFKE